MRNRTTVKNSDAKTEFSGSALRIHELYGKGGSLDGQDPEDWFDEERLVLSVRKSER
jgi:hypothetical protein